MDRQYQIVINGRRVGEPSQQETVDWLASLLFLSREEVEHSFRQLPWLVRGYLKQEEALLYQRVMERFGILCEVRLESRRPRGTFWGA